MNRICKGLFLDSVVLMQISRTIAELEGVEDAALMIGTPSNLGILDDAGLLEESGRTATGGDLVLAVRAQNESTAVKVLDKAEALLKSSGSNQTSDSVWHPRTLRSAKKILTDANLALVSVPGDFAGGEARKALRAGMHVMIFSDNVPLSEEVALKREAFDLGLLVMGPDCGTSIIAGVPLAFANRVPLGDIGIVGASGTGIQEVSSLIAQHGHGVSHALGVGGRDLNETVGGISTITALDMLDSDPATRHLVLISKPPSVSVSQRVIEKISCSEKTFTVCFIGANPPELPENVSFARTLKQAAQQATGNPDKDTGSESHFNIPHLAPSRKRIKGLFSGGTLAAEAQVVFLDHNIPVASNVPIAGAKKLDEADGHLIIDLGNDEYTKGRPHPMIDSALRENELAKTLQDPTIAVILLDVVIGLGSHPDPAGSIIKAVTAVGRDRPIVVASVTGTNMDPQGLGAQVSKLVDGGVLVASANADAAKLALNCIIKNH